MSGGLSCSVSVLLELFANYLYRLVEIAQTARSASPGAAIYINIVCLDGFRIVNGKYLVYKIVLVKYVGFRLVQFWARIYYY